MKKYIIGALLLAFSLGFAGMEAKAQEDLQVSPRTWVLDTLGLTTIDTHVAVQLSQIENVMVEVSGLDVNGQEKHVDSEILYIGSDLRGDLVIKFQPDLDDLVMGDVLNVHVAFEFIDGETEDYSETFYGIEVKRAEMFKK